MARKPIDQLGDLQRLVLESLWELDGATVQDMVDHLAQRRRRPAYTTVLTTLQNLEKAGWAKHKRQGRVYRYLPKRSRAEAGISALRAFVSRAFGGDSRLMFEALLDDEQLSAEDRQRLRTMLDDKDREVEDAN